MPLPTIVHAYVDAAVKHAIVERLEDGTIVATVPEAFGVVAFGADHLECGANLSARLEDWVRVSRANGFTLPVIDGIDLDSVDGQALASYHEDSAPPMTGRVFNDEREFESALDEWAKHPASS